MNAAPPSTPAPVDVGFDPAAAGPAPAERPVRPVPPWLVAVVLAGCLAGAGWFVWTNWLRAGPAERIVFLDRGPGDGVRPAAGPGRFEVRSGGASLLVTKTGDRDADLAFKWVRQEYLTAEQVEVLTAVFRLVGDAAMAAELNVTPAQLEALKANRARAKVDLPDADRARLKSLFLAYDAEQDPARKRAAETSLVRALDAAAAALEPASARSAAERTADAKSVLTPEQLERFKSAGR